MSLEIVITIGALLVGLILGILIGYTLDDKSVQELDDVPDPEKFCNRCKFYSTVDFGPPKCVQVNNLSSADGTPEYSACMFRKHKCKGRYFIPKGEE